MSRHTTPEPDPRSELEDEGIPDLQAGTPAAERAVDPQRAPVPADLPTAVDDFGTTADEQAAGEPLDGRLSREEPEEQAMFGEGDPTAWPAREEHGNRADGRGALSRDGGLGVGADLDTQYEPSGSGTAADWAAQPEEPSGQVWDAPRPAGRLVAPDEGAHPDSEPEAVADEAGPDSGGYTAEESAMRVEDPDRDDSGSAPGQR